MGANQNLPHVIDPHNHKRYYELWKNSGMNLKNLSEQNRKILIEFLEDMEIGKNVNPGSKKGARSFGRLRNLKSKLQTIFAHFQMQSNKDDITKATDDDMLRLFKMMREGKLKSFRTTQTLKAVGTYVKIFKTFWHWHMRKQRKQGNNIFDITLDLDAKEEKPKFVYFTIDQLKKLCDHAKFDYKVIMMFMFDSGIRSPTELLNTRLSDLEWNEKDKFYSLNIRDEVSKTFGRKIKLILCSAILKDFITEKKLTKNDYLFAQSNPKIINEYLRNLGYKILKLGKKEKGKNWISSGLTMYDFRHSSACYWLPRYKSESALKYRFGWKKSDMIHYYTDFMGMKDTIQEEDMYVDITKTELEKEIEEEKNKRNLMEEQLATLQKQIEEKSKKDDFVFKFIKGLVEKGKIKDAIDIVKDEKLEKELLKLAQS